LKRIKSHTFPSSTAQKRKLALQFAHNFLSNFSEMKPKYKPDKKPNIFKNGDVLLPSVKVLKVL